MTLFAPSAPDTSKETLRALFVTRDNPRDIRGGVETFLDDLRRLFPRSSCLSYAGLAGRRLVFNEARDARRAAALVREHAIEAKTDVIIANGASAWAFDRIRDVCPIVTVYHGTYAGFAGALRPLRPWHAVWTKRVGGFLERAAGRASTRRVAVSAGVAEEVSRHYGLDAEVIENAMPPRTRSRDAERARRDLGWPSRPTVLFVGRPTREKGFDLVRQLASRRPELSFVTVGSRHTGQPSIRSLGPVPRNEMASVFDAADVVVLPSRYEGCSYVLLEALGADRPIVTSAVGAFREPGVHSYGVVLEQTDVEKLEEATMLALENRAHFRPLESSLGRFSFEHFARAWTELVREVIRGE